jgi:hypothetical protein
MEGCENMQFKQCAVIEFLTVEKIPAIDIHRYIAGSVWDKCVDVSTVRHWLWQFNLLKTKRRLLYLKTQSVPRSKHFPSRL